MEKTNLNVRMLLYLVFPDFPHPATGFHLLFQWPKFVQQFRMCRIVSSELLASLLQCHERFFARL
ncbi:hypothetical protein EBU02_00280 [bacterium]|nr:hypothetical protein [bacterium]